MADWPWRRAVAARPRWSRGRRHLVAPAVASRQCGRRLAGRRSGVRGTASPSRPHGTDAAAAAWWSGAEAGGGRCGAETGYADRNRKEDWKSSESYSYIPRVTSVQSVRSVRLTDAYDRTYIGYFG